MSCIVWGWHCQIGEGMDSKIDKSELLAYLAGIVDGEGSIFNELPRNEHSSPIPRVCLGMVGQSVPQLLQDTFGGTLRLREPCGLGKLPLWYWQATGWRAQDICTQLYPYLIVKRDKAKECIEAKLSTQSEAARARALRKERDANGRFMKTRGNL